MNDPRDTSPELLLDHTGWIRGLSRCLVRDQSFADDLAQDACVAALEHPEQVRRSPRAWLGTVLRNRVRESARRDERRRRRERVAAALGAAPDTSEVVARAQLHATLVKAVLDLQEPYREAILLRYFDELPPRKIAARLDVPVSTVHTRLTRAIDRLRTALDRHHGDDREQWLRAVVLLVGPTAAPLATKASLVAGAVLAVGGALALVRGDGRATPPPREPPVTLAVLPISTADENEPVNPVPPQDEEPGPLHPAPSPSLVHVSPRTTKEDARPRRTGRPTPVVTDPEGLRQTIAAYFRARHDEDYRGMARSFERLAGFGDVANLAPASLRFLFSAPITPERRLRRQVVLERDVDVALVGGKTVSVDYLLRVPPRYRHGTPTPTLLLLPPDLERADEAREWLERTIPDRVLAEVLVVVPRTDGPGIDWDSDDGRQRGFFALSDVCQRFDVDRLRLFLAGSGEDVDALASALPSLLTGVVRLDRTEHAPESSHEVGHVAHLDLPPGPLDGAVLSDFLTDTRKVVAPRDLAWAAPTPLHSNVYWLSLSHPDQEFDEQSPTVVHATIDRDRNTIIVETDERVRGFTVYLNDDLVDLSRTIRVVHGVRRPDGSVDKRTVFEETREPSLEFALTCWFLNLSGNLGEVYVTSIEVDLDPQNWK